VSSARIEVLGAGRFVVGGALNASTVTDLLKQSRERFAGVTRIELDLNAVSEGDSAGLALILEWLRAARHAGQKINFINMPAQIAALARISEVDDLLAASSTDEVNEVPQTDRESTVPPKTQTA